MSNSPSRRHLPPAGPSWSASTATREDDCTTLSATANSLPETLLAETHSASRQQQGARNMRPGPVFEQLPEEILHYIHSLLTVQDAARAACVSRGLLHAWRCYSHLKLNEHTLGLADKTVEEQKTYIIKKVDQILENHHNNRVKVETLKLRLVHGSYGHIKASSLNRWLQITVKSGIKKLDLSIPLQIKKEYNFPCAVLSDEAAASSIKSLHLHGCAFTPTSSLGILRRLTCLHLFSVRVTEEGLRFLLSKSPVLEKLDMYFCRGIVCLRIAFTLQQLKYLSLIHCTGLQSVQIDAPKLCSFRSDEIGILKEICLRNSSQLKNVDLSSIFFSDARARLPSIIPNVESLILQSRQPSKFPYLKNLEIELHPATMPFPPSHDIFSLVSFLDASPVLDSFILPVEQDATTPDLISGEDDVYTKRKLEYRHDHLRKVLITWFCPSRSLVELTIHILESTASLERLTLDLTYGYDRRWGTVGRCPASTKNGLCLSMSKKDLAGARRGVEIAGQYIVGRVPTNVQFEVLGPCTQCHSVER
ncbi:hypothetical protein VPH35_011025 [Triticum aestivum]